MFQCVHVSNGSLLPIRNRYVFLHKLIDIHLHPGSARGLIQYRWVNIYKNSHDDSVKLSIIYKFVNLMKRVITKTSKNIELI